MLWRVAQDVRYGLSTERMIASLSSAFGFLATPDGGYRALRLDVLRGCAENARNRDSHGARGNARLRVADGDAGSSAAGWSRAWRGHSTCYGCGAARRPLAVRNTFWRAGDGWREHSGGRAADGWRGCAGWIFARTEGDAAGSDGGAEVRVKEER